MLETTVASSVLILTIIVFRSLFKRKLDSRVQYAMWLLVAIRLILPLPTPHNQISVLNLLSRIDNSARFAVNPAQLGHPNFPNDDSQRVPGTDNALAPESTPGAGESANPTTVSADANPSASNQGSPYKVLRVIWFAGAATLGLIFALQYVWLYTKIKKTRTKLERPNTILPVYISPYVKSPCLFGLSPAIYVPPFCPHDETLKYILAHEETHCKHGDHLWSCVRCLCLAIHWFNPFVWWAAFLSKTDCELACDQSTLARFGDAHRKAYGNTLLNMVQHLGEHPKPFVGAITITSGSSGIKERIKMIAEKPKMRPAMVLVMVLFLVAAVGCTFTGPQKEPNGSQQEAGDGQHETDNEPTSTGDIHDYMPLLMAGETVEADELLPCLENFTRNTWRELHEAYDFDSSGEQMVDPSGRVWFSVLWVNLRDFAVNEDLTQTGDQKLRDYYIGKAYVVSDGAYSEGLSDIIIAQWNHDCMTYNDCLNELFSQEESDRLRDCVKYHLMYWYDDVFGLLGTDLPGALYLNPYPVDFPFGLDLTEKNRETFKAESFGQVTVVESDGLQVTYLTPANGVYNIITLRANRAEFQALGVAIGDTEQFLTAHGPEGLKTVDGISYDDEAWFGQNYDRVYAYTPENSVKSVVFIVKDGLVSGIIVVNGLDGPAY